MEDKEEEKKVVPTYELNRKNNRPRAQGYSIQELWNNQIGPNFIERYKNRELGKEKADQILRGLEETWDDLGETHQNNIITLGNTIGSIYQDLRTSEGAELLNPIANQTATAIRAGEVVLNTVGAVSDFTLGNLGRGVGWLAGLDPRWREGLAIGAQLYLGPKAIKGVSKIKPKHLGIKQSISKIAPLDDAVPYTKKLINITDESQLLNIIDDTFKYDIETFSKARQIYKHHPDAGWKTALTRAQQLKGITNKGLIKEFTSGSLMKGGLFDPNRDDTTRLQFTGSVDKDDIPTYKNAPLDLNTAVHPTTYDGINTINTLLNKHGGLKSARLNLKAVNAKGHLSKRILSSVFLTPYGKGGNFKATVRNKKSVFYTMFGTEYEKMGLATKMKSGQATEPIQGHHGDSPLAVVLPGFEGIVKESPRYNRFVNVFLDEMLALGDMPENIRIVYGHVKRDPDGPHALSHAFGDFKLGKSGQKFWTKEKLDQIVVYDKDGNAIGTKNDDLREKFIRDQIVILKENIEVLDNAMEQYKLLFAKKAFDPIELVDYFETKLPGIRDTELGGYLPMIMDKFVTGTVLEEAATVQANPITKADAKQIIANIFETENVRQWRKWSVPKRKARMAEITGGYSFERLEELIDKGWMDGNRLNKLFEDPLDDLK